MNSPRYILSFCARTLPWHPPNVNPRNATECLCLLCVCRTNEEVLEVIRSGRSSAVTLCQATILWEQAPDDKDVRHVGMGRERVLSHWLSRITCDFFTFNFSWIPCLSLLAYPGPIVSIIALKQAYSMFVYIHMRMQHISRLYKHQHQCWLYKHELYWVNLHGACELKHAFTYIDIQILGFKWSLHFPT